MKPQPNNSLQATRDGGSSSASRFTSFGPACLSLDALAFMTKERNHSPMTNAEWKHCFIGFLDAVEHELHADAPTEDRNALRALRSSLERKRVTQARKPYEQKIDRLVDNHDRPYLWAAAHRHIGKVAPAAVEQAAASLKRARDLLNRASNTALEPTPTAHPVLTKP